MTQPLPTDDRWFLAYDPTLELRGWETKPWVMATRCDGGFRTEDGNYVHPQRWEPLPDPKPDPTGWRWPEGTIYVSPAEIPALNFRGWTWGVDKPDGSPDLTREPDLCRTEEQALERAEKFAAWSGLPIRHERVVIPFKLAGAGE